MAGEIQVKAVTGVTLYAVVLGPAGTAFNGSAFEVIEADNWTTYDLALAESDGTGIYLGSFPAVAAGVYSVSVYRMLGGAPATTDPVIAAGEVRWAGSVREPVSTGDSFARIGANGAGLTDLASQASVNAVDDLLDTEIADIQSRLPAALVGGRMASIAEAVGAGAINNAAFAAGAIDSTTLAADTIGSSELAASAIAEIRDAILSDSTPFAGASVATITTNVSTLLTRIPAALFAGITSLAQWLGLIAGKQVGDSTARTEMRATGAGSGTFDETTDSAEAIRDRGDAAWVTGAGGGLDAAGVRAAVGLAAANLDTQLAALLAALPRRVRKNTALDDFPFVMLSSTDHVTPLAGLTVTATRSIDGGAFAACANAPAAISNGAYKIDLAASDLNGDAVILRLIATGADPRLVSIITQP